MKLKISTAEQLSTHFKSLRKAKGWSQADLGKRIGLKQARVAQIEGDPGSISVDKLFQVLHALEADFVIETRDSEPQQISASPVSSPNSMATIRQFLQSAPGTHRISPGRSLNLIVRDQFTQTTSTTPAGADLEQVDVQRSDKSIKTAKDE